MIRRERFTFEFSSSQRLKKALFAFGSRQDATVKLFLDGNTHPDPYGAFDALLALDPENTINIEQAVSGDWKRLNAWQKDQKDWCFGHIAYDFKNAEENLQSQNPDFIGFPEAHFFVPGRLLFVNNNTLTGLYIKHKAQHWTQDLQQIKDLYQDVAQQELEQKASGSSGGFTFDCDSGIELKGRWSKKQYTEKFDQIQKHIQRGDIYETNFCQEFYREHIALDPVALFEKLNAFSKAPFSAYYQVNHCFALCASPERYLTKKGTALISQPIKGTLKRLSDPKRDQIAVDDFVQNPKERRENIMITDLVRNDLSRVAARDSVRVKELCALKSYAHVHQMVTTVTAQLKQGLDAVEALRTTFPMGSMTGVPKIRALQLMEDFEAHKRGLYSGTIGYFTPEGDFDFNVVIRTLLYNQKAQYLSLSVGGALTSSANAQDEYQECLLKAESLRTVLSRG